ncbi:WXG100 family type VII secretion target [Amycolatopsis sp. NBC_00355]|uniref:WXG100 family type VII secretion target n=1 Tax=Amycolatopsis sp. NBC_00355 TaxID=2975957 RepID=UPI002E265F0E
MSYPALGRDPAPGDPERVENTADIFRSVSSDAREARNRLQAVSDSGIDAVWIGDAAKAFERSLHELCADLDRLTNSYGEVGDALTTYAVELRQCKDDARQHEAAAEAAEADEANFDRQHREAAEKSAAYATQSRSAQGRIVTSRLQQTVSSAVGDVAGATTAQNLITQDLRVSQEADSAKSQADGDARYTATQADLARQRLTAARRLADQVSELQHDAGDRAAAKIDDAGKVADKYHHNTFEAILQGFNDVISSPGFDHFLNGLSEVGSLLTAAAPFVAIFAPHAAAVMYGLGVAATGIAALGRIAQAAQDHRKAGEAGEALLSFGFALLGGVGRAGALVRPSKELSWWKDATSLKRDVGADLKRLLSPADHGSHVVLNSAKLSGTARKLTEGFTTAEVPLGIQNMAHGNAVTAAARTIVARGYFTGNVVMRPVSVISAPVQLGTTGFEVGADLTHHNNPVPPAVTKTAEYSDYTSTAWKQLWDHTPLPKK